MQASPSAPADASVKASVSRSSSAVANAATCKVNTITYNRYESCLVADARVDLLRNGRPVGHARFKITQKLTLKQKALKWSESVEIGRATLVNASGIRVGLKVSCGGTCKADNKFPRGRSLGPVISGKVNYSSGVKKNKKDTTAAKYTFTFTKPGFTPGTIEYKSVAFRCDDTFWNQANTRRTLSPGCVYPSFTPTLTTMGTLPNISRHIRNVQAGGGHYGRPGSGKPLHREANQARADQNRQAVCPRGQRPPGPGLSCDEYPFATTREGGTNVPANSRGTAWVPQQEQNQQGGRITTFHKKERVIDRDAFWVKV
ncbi:NucA/NucB deoxyribonuclease domain-containing protein [Streptomyces sp. NPDC055078]